MKAEIEAELEIEVELEIEIEIEIEAELETECHCEEARRGKLMTLNLKPKLKSNVFANDTGMKQLRFLHKIATPKKVRNDNKITTPKGGLAVTVINKIATPKKARNDRMKQETKKCN